MWSGVEWSDLRDCELRLLAGALLWSQMAAASSSGGFGLAARELVNELYTTETLPAYSVSAFEPCGCNCWPGEPVSRSNDGACAVGMLMDCRKRASSGVSRRFMPSTGRLSRPKSQSASVYATKPLIWRVCRGGLVVISNVLGLLGVHAILQGAWSAAANHQALRPDHAACHSKTGQTVPHGLHVRRLPLLSWFVLPCGYSGCEWTSCMLLLGS